MCFFECDDDFYDYFLKDTGPLCKQTGKGMNVLIMPHFSDGDIAHFAWTVENIHILRSCLQMAVLSYIDAYTAINFVHGDFHPANVMIKPTKQRTMTFGDVEVATHGYRTWIMDFENSTIGAHSRSWTDLCFDLQKMFMILTTFVQNLDKVKLQKIIKAIFLQEERGSVDPNALHAIIGDNIQLL